MSKIGMEILNEYVSEVNEQIEDDKLRLYISQGLSIAHSIWRLFLLSINLFFAGALFLMVFFLLSLDNEHLDLLREASNENILSGITQLFFLIKIMVIFGVLAVALFFSTSYFRSKKAERRYREQQRADLIETIIQINEEVLLRHGLIKTEENPNG
ncbi:MAG: hypothetical protein JKY42_11680 [Flavobacteriales bacterium]|nr:hypothetical protein [Flavobacteriales bacterium]